MENTEMVCGKAKKLSICTFTKSGYSFKGWSASKDATSATYKDGQSMKGSAKSDIVTLYAVWEKDASDTSQSSSVGAGTIAGTKPYNIFKRILDFFLNNWPWRK